MSVSSNRRALLTLYGTLDVRSVEVHSIGFNDKADKRITIGTIG